MFRIIIVSLLFVLSLVAQDEPPVPNVPVPPIPVPGAVPPPGVVPPQPEGDADPGEPNDQPPPALGLRPVPDPNTPATLNAANLTGQDVADLYFQYTGKRVLVSQEASAGEISFIVPGQMTYSEAATIIEKKLVMEGFEMVPDDDDPNLMKLVLAASQTGVKAQGPPVVDSLDGLEGPADRFVTYVMALQYLKPDDALRAFQTVVQQFGAAGTVAAVPNAGSVVISGNLPLVRMLAELKERIDVPSAQVATKFVEVTYADVEDLSERLNEIFNTQRQNQQSARVQRTGAPAAPAIPTPANPAAGAATGGGAQPGAAGEETPVHIIPHPRTSRIFLMGRPVDLIFIEGLIADFDAPSSKRNFLQLKLRYLPVIEFLDVAAEAINRTLETGGGPGGAAGGARTTSTRRSTGVGGGANTGINQIGGRTQTGGQFGQTGGAGGGSRAQIQQQQIDTRPEPLLIGKTLLVADNISNSIIVNGPPHHIEIVEDLVEKLDQPSEQVAITAVFGSYNISKGHTFGIDLAAMINGGRDFTGAAQNRGYIPGGQAVIDPNTILDLSGLLNTGASRGLNTYLAIGDSFGVFVNALESNSNFTSISRPTVFTTNNGQARLSSGQRIAIPTSTFQGGTATGQSTNIEFRDITLELVVTPLVNSKDEVTLDISLVRDGVGADRVVGELIVPDINTDEVSTRVTVPNKATIVLGGLILEEDDKGGSGIPILRSIPGIGPLFGSINTNKRRSELVILIHPTILTNRTRMTEAKGAGLAAPMTDLAAYQDEYDTKSAVAPRARAAVEGVGVLPDRGEYNPNVGRAVPVQETRGRGAVTSPTHKALRNRRRR